MAIVNGINGDAILDDILSMDFVSAAAQLGSSGSWPTALYALVITVFERVTGATRTTSATSVVIGTGPKSLVLAAYLGLKAGDPVVIQDAASPNTNHMEGFLTADQDETTKEITVNIERATGSGTFTNWKVLLAVAVVSTGFSTPVAVAEGGTGGATAPIARQSLSVGAGFVVEQVSSTGTVNGSLSAGDKVLVAGSAPPADAFIGHQDKIATWDGSAWAFEAPALGDSVLVVDSGQAYVYRDTGSNLLGEVPSEGSKWYRTTSQAAAKSYGATVTATGNILLDEGMTYLVVAPTTAITLTLEAAGPKSGYILYVINTGSATATFNVALGGSFTSGGATPSTVSVPADSTATFVQAATWGVF